MKNLWLAGAFFVIFAGSLHMLGVTYNTPAQESVSPELSEISPAAGDSTTQPPALSEAESTAEPVVLPSELPLPPEYISDEPIRIAPDETRAITLDRDVSSVVVSNPEHAVVVMDSARTMILMPRRPGTTHFTAIDSKGRTVFDKRVIIAPKAEEQYVRIRKVCDNRGGMTAGGFGGAGACQDTSYYYCPDGCYEVRPSTGKGIPSAPPAVASTAPAVITEDGAGDDDGGDEEAQTDATGNDVKLDANEREKREEEAAQEEEDVEEDNIYNYDDFLMNVIEEEMDVNGEPASTR